MLAANQAGHNAARGLRHSTPLRIAISGSAPQKILLAPQDLYTADPTQATDLYSGRFALGGSVVECQQSNPFEQDDVPEGWQRELHAFGWIRHLEKEGSARSHSNIQARISDWLKACGQPSSGIAWRNDVAARRLIAWICHAVPVVENASAKFYGSWLKSIGTHIRYLKVRCESGEPGMHRLLARIALAYAAICVDGQSRRLAKAPDRLAAELVEQIFSDGGHITRNPQVLLDLLALLLPLRESYMRLGTNPSVDMISAIDRMMAAVKFFRLGDGNLARFNSSNGGRSDLLATILQYDDFRGTAPESAIDSGFQRMELEDTVLIADTGPPPPAILSRNSHAGTLSFEMSSGGQLVIVNCGSPAAQAGDVFHAARATAAHSTLTLNETSSTRFYRNGVFSRLLYRQKISGVSAVSCDRENDDRAKRFEAEHNGYLSAFGVMHSRRITLLGDGQRIEGTDTLTGRNGRPLPPRAKADFAIRFHLHPSVSAGKTDNGISILLMCGNGRTWKLTCIDAAPQIEDSVYFSPASGPRRTKQVVLYGSGRETPEIRWLLAKQDVAA